jgi:hypothetical protein
MSSQLFKRILSVIVYIFAIIGFVLVAGYFAIKFGLTNEKGIIDEQRDAFFGSKPSASAILSTITAEPAYIGPWQQSEEWNTMETAIRKDQAVIQRAADDSGVPARLITANLVAEQLRLFFTEREAYKKWFYPLKILGPQSQFSWGVMGMKEDTAIHVEENLRNPDSPYYPGAQFEHLLDFPPGTTDIPEARFTRMTDQHDHYWSYLYAGLYLKEVEAQWAKAGHPISSRVDLLSTLYNIGFAHSSPNANPQVGGAAITLSDGTRSFGALAKEFYDSTLLSDIFPQ